MTYYSAEALNGLIGRMVKVEFADGTVEVGLLSVPGPAYGSRITDAEKAKIIGLTVEHCRKSEPDPYTLVIHKTSQGRTWWIAFKALFWYMEGWQ